MKLLPGITKLNYWHAECSMRVGYQQHSCSADAGRKIPSSGRLLCSQLCLWNEQQALGFFKDVSWSSGYTPKYKWIKSPCDDLLVTPAVYIPMLNGWSFTANGSDRNTSFICLGKKKASVMLWCLDKPHPPRHIVNRRSVPWSWVCHAWLIHQPWQSCSD